MRCYVLNVGLPVPGRLLGIAVLLAALASLSACGSPASDRAPQTDTPGDASTSTPIATTTAGDASPPPTYRRNVGKVSGPADPSEGIAGSTYADLFVADFASGQLFTITPASYPCWLDDDTLIGPDGMLFPLPDNGAPLPTVEPSANPCREPPADALLPRAGGRTWDNPPRMNSADGLWTLVRQGTTSHIDGPSGRTIDVPGTDTFAWSPAGHLLAVGGGWCSSEHPLQIVDPDSGTPPIVPRFTARPLAYIWKPGGSGIAVGTASSGAVVTFLDASDGTTMQVWPRTFVRAPGPLIPLSYNPSGTRMLFYFYIHRGCS
jgi:hypothetical protein